MPVTLILTLTSEVFTIGKSHIGKKLKDVPELEEATITRIEIDSIQGSTPFLKRERISRIRNLVRKPFALVSEKLKDKEEHFTG